MATDPNPTPTPDVRDVPERHRYELRVDGTLVGLVGYRARGSHRSLDHAEVDPAWGGRGLGTLLARATLDDVRARGLTVTPACPFIAHFIDTHPDYADLVGPADGTRPA